MTEFLIVTQVVRRLASALAGRSPGGNDILYVGRRGLASLCWPPEAEGKLDFVHATAASSTEGVSLYAALCPPLTTHPQQQPMTLH